MVQEPEIRKEKKKNTGSSSALNSSIIVVLIAIIAVFAVIGILLFQQNQNPAKPARGDNAPDFTLTSFDGETYRLRDLRGQILVVNVWASWCGPCHAEAEDLQQIHEDYQSEGVLMLGVDIIDIETEALEFIDFYGISYPNAPDEDGQYVEAYHIQGPPETVIIGRDGRIVANFIGGTTYEAISQVLNEILEEER